MDILSQLLLILDFMWHLKCRLGILLILVNTHLGAQYITYESDIKPIMQKHCISCHAPGEMGPMPLTTFEEVSAYGNMILYATSNKLMPPWLADPAYSHFKNERILSQEEIQTIRDWVAGEMKPGALPYGMAISNVAGVTVYPREPDIILSMTSSFEQTGDYMDRHQVFKLSPNLKEDNWIEAIEFVPGNKDIVRYAEIRIVPYVERQVIDTDPGYKNLNLSDINYYSTQPLLYTWTPHQQTVYHTDGRGKFMPKDAELLLYVHYGPVNTSMQDSSFIQIHFATERIKQFIHIVPLINAYNTIEDSMIIAAGEEKSFHASYTLPHEIEMYSLMPQANLFCRRWEIFAKIPGQTDMIPLLKIDDWNFNWKQTFHLASPLHLPAGAILHAIAHYDNTTHSPGNHNKPPVDFRPGDENNREMFSVQFEYTVSMPEVASPVLVHIPSAVSYDHLPVYLLPSKKGDYRFEIVSMVNYKTYYSQSFMLQANQQNMYLDLPSLPLGNYLLTIWNDDNQIVSSHAFVKFENK